MADTKWSAVTSKTSPIPADSLMGIDSAGPTGARFTFQNLHQAYTNQSTTSQSNTFATDIYLAGSAITIPTGAPFVGTTYKLAFSVVKTGAGTATPIITIRTGTGVVGDTARNTFTFGAGTAAIDTGIFMVTCTFRTVGSGTTAVLQGMAGLMNAGAAGIVGTGAKGAVATSGGFDSTTANLVIGASYNAGTSASHTVSLVRAELML